MLVTLLSHWVLGIHRIRIAALPLGGRGDTAVVVMRPGANPARFLDTMDRSS